MTFEQLMLEHDEIDRLTWRLEDCAGRDVPDIYAVIEARSALKAVLDHHLGHEDASIYPGLMRAGGEAAQAIADFDARFARLRLDWGTYLMDWDAECLAADWGSFRTETTTLMARVRERTRAETDLLYPLALQTGAIALRNA